MQAPTKKTVPGVKAEAEPSLIRRRSEVFPRGPCVLLTESRAAGAATRCCVRVVKVLPVSTRCQGFSWAFLPPNWTFPFSYLQISVNRLSGEPRNLPMSSPEITQAQHVVCALRTQDTPNRPSGAHPAGLESDRSGPIYGASSACFRSVPWTGGDEHDPWFLRALQADQSPAPRPIFCAANVIQPLV